MADWEIFTQALSLQTVVQLYHRYLSYYDFLAFVDFHHVRNYLHDNTDDQQQMYTQSAYL